MENNLKSLSEHQNIREPKLVNVIEFKKPIITDSNITEFINNIDAKETTKKTYKQGLSIFKKYCDSNNITIPTQKDIIEFKQKLVNNNQAPSTINSYISVIKKFYNYQSENNQVKNIAKDIKFIDIDKEYRKEGLTDNEVCLLLEAIRGTGKTYKKEGEISKYDAIDSTIEEIERKRNILIFYLLLFNGNRVKELSSMNIEDIGTINNSHIIYVLGKGKDTKTDYIVLSPIVYNALMDYLAIRGNTKPQEPLFISHGNRNKGNRLSKVSIAKMITENMKKAKIKRVGISTHSLRHTTASNLAREGADIDIIMATLRHSRAETSQIYLDRDIKEKKRVRGQELLLNKFNILGAF